MSRRPAAVLLLAAVLGGTAAASPAQAAPRVLKASYETGVTLPDPSTGGLPRDTCEGLPTSHSRRSVSLPSAGMLEVTLTSTGDWGLVVRTARGRALGRADTAFAGEPERLVVRLRGRGTVVLDACNFAGAPTARVAYTFTPRR